MCEEIRKSDSVVPLCTRMPFSHILNIQQTDGLIVVAVKKDIIYEYITFLCYCELARFSLFIPNYASCTKTLIGLSKPSILFYFLSEVTS